MNITDIEKNYILHDCTIDNIFIKDSKVIIHFSSGIYKKELNGIRKTPPCFMELLIDNLDISSAYMHISICALKRGKYREISFINLKKMLENSILSLYLAFFSDFCKGILLKCNASKSEIEIQITDISKICFLE